MDVKYIPSDWEKMKDGIGDLIGLGRLGKGMIDELKDLSDILEDAESDIAKYDVDGAITFQHTSLKSKYQGLFEDFDVLHTFSGKVGDIVDRTIDQPFYEDMDAFVEAMRNLSISNYTTTNRIGATEIVQSYAGYGVPQQFEIDKAEVSLDDLLSGDSFYGEQMKLEYEAWKELNPDQNFSQKEYQQAIVNTRAFEYESIRNTQENKEFWVQIGALVVIVGTTLICPPAGIALGATYGAYELSSAISGKDLVSGRELETSERWMRGLLAPLDIVPGVSGIAKFGSAARLARVGDNLGPVAIRSSMKGGIQQGAARVHNMVVETGKSGTVRLRSAGTVIQNRANVMVNKAKEGTIEGAKLADKSITGAKNFFQIPKEGMALAGVGPVGKTREVFENTHAVENRVKDIISRSDGVNLTKDSVEPKPDSNIDNLNRGKMEEVLDSSEITIEDRSKLEGWAYPPSDEKYLKYKEVYDNPKYYNQKTGNVNWPPNNGFEGEAVKTELEKGIIIDRYGNPNGTFVSPADTPYEQRALALHSDEAPYHKYLILEPFDVEAGKIAPWFDRPGGGTQYFTGNIQVLDIDTGEMVDATVENLLRLGYIREIK